MTPLLVAAFRVVNTQMVTELLTNGADPNISDNEGWTPLHAAVLMDQTQTVTELLTKGANPDTPNSDGKTPLYIAKQKNNTVMVTLIEAAIQNWE